MTSKRLDDEIQDALRDWGPLNAEEVADYLCVPTYEVRDALEDLEHRDQVDRYPGGSFDWHG